MRGSRWPKALAVNYLSKYASKGVKVLDLPDGMVREFVQAWWRFRTLRTFGTLFRAKMPPEDAWDGVMRCPVCKEPGFPYGVAVCAHRDPSTDPPRLPGATPPCSRRRAPQVKLRRLPGFELRGDQ